MKGEIAGRQKKTFTRLLLKWNREKNRRQMPWKGEKDPYKIWLSEIILQQTRVEQGWSYYSNFLKVFPDIKKLAAAPDEQVMKMWEGLGYYARCRNLLHTARFIAVERNGVFPDSYEAIGKLKGVGPYTAAAIASFAFNLPYAVVDGNVFRVLARYFGISLPVDTTKGKQFFSTLAAELLDPSGPGIYNQAIMDFGATVCTPQQPACKQCPMARTCIANNEQQQDRYPQKEKKIKIRRRRFYYLVISARGKYAIHQRTGNDIWKGLYEFPLAEQQADFDKAAFRKQLRQWGLPAISLAGIPASLPVLRQQLSHQLIEAYFIPVKLPKQPTGNDWQWVSRTALSNFAWPVIIRQYLGNS